MYVAEHNQSKSLLRTVTRLNRLIDNHRLVDYWQSGIEFLRAEFGAQGASLYLLEPVEELESNRVHAGLLSQPILQCIQGWERQLNKQMTSANGTEDDTLPETASATIDDSTIVFFPTLLGGITAGSLSLVWSLPESPSRDAIGDIHQVVQMYVSNGLRANRLVVTHRGRERSELLYLIAQELTRTLELNAVLNQTTQLAATVLKAQASTLFRVDDINQQLIFMIPKGEAASVLEEYRMPIDQGVAGYVATKGESLIVNDTQNHELFDSAVDSQTGFQTRNILCVPLRLQERTIGVLEVLNKDDEGGFTEEDKEWLTTMGNQVAIAFENAHLFAREQERVEELATLNTVSQTINSELDVTVILDKITQAVLDILSASRSELFLVSPDKKHLNLASSAGLGTQKDMSGWQIPVGKGLAGWSAEENRSICVRTARDDPRYITRPELTSLEETSVAVAPLAHRGRVIGVISVHSKPGNPYDSDRLDLLQTFANQAAISLQNAELYQNLRAEQERIIKAQEEVRHQLARDLHDNTAQMLSLIIMNLDLTRQMFLNNEVDEIEGEFDELENLARQANREIRTLLFELRPIILESRGLIPALDAYHNQLNQSMECKVHLDTVPLGFQIKLQGASTIFSIIQEAVNNIRKHAHAKNIWIRVYVENEFLYFTVEDDGVGFDFDATIADYDGSGSFGLLNMHERAAILDGNLTIKSPRPNEVRGTMVAGAIPIANLKSQQERSGVPLPN